MYCGAVVRSKPKSKKDAARPRKALSYRTGGDKGIGELAGQFADSLRKNAPSGLRWRSEQMADKKHSTIYHPVALKAFRTMTKPADK
jgi:hypothetical protein